MPGSTGNHCLSDHFLCNLCSNNWNLCSDKWSDSKFLRGFLWCLCGWITPIATKSHVSLSINHCIHLARRSATRSRKEVAAFSRNSEQFYLCKNCTSELGWKQISTNSSTRRLFHFCCGFHYYGKETI